MGKFAGADQGAIAEALKSLVDAAVPEVAERFEVGDVIGQERVHPGLGQPSPRLWIHFRWPVVVVPR